MHLLRHLHAGLRVRVGTGVGFPCVHWARHLLPFLQELLVRLKWWEGVSSEAPKHPDVPLGRKQPSARLPAARIQIPCLLAGPPSV